MNREKLRAVFEKTGGFCWYCGVQLQPLGVWEVEHQTPRSRGGSDSLDNLVAACRPCNARKGNRTVDEYRRSLFIQLEAQINHAINDCFEINKLTGGLFGNDKDADGYFEEPLLEIHDRLLDVLSLVPRLDLITFVFEEVTEERRAEIIAEGQAENS